MTMHTRSILAPCVTALTLFVAMAHPAVANDKEMSPKGEATIKMLLENDKVQVRETSWKPGQVRPSEAIGQRVVRVIKGGTVVRLYPDGKTQEITFKTGEVKWFDASTSSTTPYSIKNIGKTDVVLYAVILK